MQISEHEYNSIESQRADGCIFSKLIQLMCIVLETWDIPEVFDVR